MRVWGFIFWFGFLFIDSYVTSTFPRRTLHLHTWQQVFAMSWSPFAGIHAFTWDHSAGTECTPALSSCYSQGPCQLNCWKWTFFSQANLALTYQAPMWIQQRNKKAKGFCPVSHYFHYHKPYNIEERKHAPPKAYEWESAKLGEGIKILSFLWSLLKL